MYNLCWLVLIIKIQNKSFEFILTPTSDNKKLNIGTSNPTLRYPINIYITHNNNPTKYYIIYIY